MRQHLKAIAYVTRLNSEGVWMIVVLITTIWAMCHKALPSHAPSTRNGEIRALAFYRVCGAAFAYDWQAALFLVPFYYFGNCLSSLNGYYRHLNANPDVPMGLGREQL